MKWKCSKCAELDMGQDCILEFEDSDGTPPAWCPFACDPIDANEYPCWKWVESSEEEEVAPRQHDPVKHPSHYTEGRKYEPIKVIEDWKLDFCLGNALKYISRAGRKEDEIEDLKKARWYIKRRIKQLEGKK